jgi:ubiquinone/menaquinone biosynthesis C-methylase UbiE
MKIETYDLSYEIQFLDVGCGLGIDLLLVANAVIESKHKIRIVGLDFNSQMIEHA